MNEKDEIIILIDNGNLEQAKIQIESLEQKLIIEKTKYRKSILMDKIKFVKNYFELKRKIKVLNTEYNPTEAFNINSNNENTMKKDNVLYLNKNNSDFENKIYNEALIENINDKEFGLLNIENSAFIRNCKNIHFCLVASQVRLVGCENIKLTINTKTGIYLEKSKNIEIYPLKEEKNENNLYYQVHDFSAPFQTINYKIFH